MVSAKTQHDTISFFFAILDLEMILVCRRLRFDLRSTLVRLSVLGETTQRCLIGEENTVVGNDQKSIGVTAKVPVLSRACKWPVIQFPQSV